MRDTLVGELNRVLPPPCAIEPPINNIVACSACALRYLDPRIRSDDLASLYELWYRDAFPATRVGGSEAALREREFRTYHLPIVQRAAPGRRLLDVGCGSGLFVKTAREAGFDACGVERSRAAVAYGRAQYAVDLQEGTLADLQATDGGSFDVVTMFDYLEHTETPRQDIAAARNLLRPGGVLVVRVPDVASWSSRLQGMAWVNVISFHLSYFDEQSLTGLLRREGLEVETVVRGNVRSLSDLLSAKLAWVGRRVADMRAAQRNRSGAPASVSQADAQPLAISGGAVAAASRFARASVLETFEHVSGWFGHGSIMTIVARRST